MSNAFQSFFSQKSVTDSGRKIALLTGVIAKLNQHKQATSFPPLLQEFIYFLENKEYLEGLPAEFDVNKLIEERQLLRDVVSNHGMHELLSDFMASLPESLHNALFYRISAKYKPKVSVHKHYQNQLVCFEMFQRADSFRHQYAKDKVSERILLDWMLNEYREMSTLDLFTFDQDTKSSLNEPDLTKKYL